MSSSPIEINKRRFLVFARVGPNTKHEEWYVPRSERNWDLQLSSYVPDISTSATGDYPVSVDTGTKIDSIYRFFHDHPQLLDEYAYVAFPDDDLIFPPGGMDFLFQTAERHDLLIAAPALSSDSYINHPITCQCPFLLLRYVNYIEGMCPCIETGYLKELMPLMSKRFSGWGLDLIWASLMQNPSRRAAIIDKVAATHTRPHRSGDIYNDLARKGIDPKKELNEVRNRYQVPEAMIVYGAVLPSGLTISATPARLFNAVYLIQHACKARVRRFAVFRSGVGMLVRAFSSYRATRVTIKQEKS